MYSLIKRGHSHQATRNTLLKYLIALTFAGSVPAAMAGSLSVAPLRLTYVGGTTIASITVENNGRVEALVQTETFAWTQPDGEHKLSPTDDIVAVPPVFRLPPGARQSVRVGLTRSFAETQEQTFRLTVTEVPTTAIPGTVAVAVRHSLPIFVRPASPTASNLTVTRATSNTLAIANNGSQHIRIHRWRVRDSAGVILAENSGPGYLLAGAHQVLAIAGPRFSGPAMLETDSDIGTTKTVVAE